jgi:hypothetical protein
MYERGERRWYVVPGGAVSESTAAKIIAQSNVIAQHDGLFPGMDQTWIVIPTVQ